MRLLFLSKGFVKNLFGYTFDIYNCYNSYDLWNSEERFSAISRHATIGISAKIPGICGRNRYSLLEFNGFVEIQNAAHELGHM